VHENRPGNLVATWGAALVVGPLCLAGMILFGAWGAWGPWGWRWSIRVYGRCELLTRRAVAVAKGEQEP
jgi:MFS family permease